MLPVLPQIVHYREQQDISFRLLLPDQSATLFQSSLRSLFVSTNWAHFISPDDFPSVSVSGERVPVRRFVNESEMAGTINELLRFLLRSREINRDTLQALEWSINEITDNVISHAESPVGGFVQATQYSSMIEFIVADAGIGIPSSLQIEDPQMALRQAVSEGATRDRSSNAGNGLFGSYRIAAVSSGEFELHSQEGVLFYDANREEAQTSREAVALPGTSVRCAIGRFHGQLLNEALMFDGNRHTPASDYVERTYETGSGGVLYAVSSHAQFDLGSRRGGTRVRQELRNLLQGHEQVVVDFSDVRVISSSFADEVFGRLFVDLGPRAFMSRLVLRNVDPTIDGLIDRAIVQRTRLSEQRES